MLAQLSDSLHAGDFVPVQLRAGFESTEMAPNVASNGDVSNGNGVHMNGNAAANGNGSAARPAVAPKSTHEDRWSGIERPYSQVRASLPSECHRHSSILSAVASIVCAYPDAHPKADGLLLCLLSQQAWLGPLMCSEGDSCKTIGYVAVPELLMRHHPEIAILEMCTSAHSNTCVAQDDVERLQGSLVVEHTLARVGAEKLWKLMREEAFVPALGALTGNQAMQQIRAGLKAVYCSGWQVRKCADNLLSCDPGSIFPCCMPAVAEQRRVTPPCGAGQK